MKKTRKEIVGIMGIAILLMSGVAIFFASCEKEDLVGMKGKIRVNFTIGETSYGENEVVTRGAGRGLASETVAVELEDGLQMYATLAEAESVPLRDAPSFGEGTRVQIVAYKKDGDGYLYEDDAEYEVTSGGIEPVNPVGLLLSSYGTYKFAAYSIQAETVPGYSDTPVVYSPNNEDDDPLFGETADILINSDNNDLAIVMRHVFSKVKVKIGIAGYTAIETPLDIRFQGYAANLKNGDFIKGTAQDQSFTFAEFTTTTSITSAERMVYAGNEAPTEVAIQSIKIDGVTYGAAQYVYGVPAIRFNMRLELGKYYTLEVDFKKVVWAGSNVYWKSTGTNTGYLTFDAPNSGDDNQKKQGLMFKWGSLVGLSPASNQATTPYSSSTLVYIPEYTDADTKGWSVTNIYDAWAEVPYLGGNITGSRYSTYLRDNERNTDAYWGEKTGDICRYISENGYGPEESGVKYNYCMPTDYELGKNVEYTWGTFGWTKTPNEGWGQSGALFSAEGTDGTRTMTYYATNTTAGVIFPCSGYRSDSGSLNYIGDCVFAWTCSPAGGGERFRMNAHNNKVDIGGSGASSSMGASIRCIKK
jgi:hypothetical protein